MNCPYCQRACTLLYSVSDASEKMTRWECQNQDPACGANFRYLENGDLFSITWKDIEVNRHKFFIKLYNGVTGNAPEFVIYYHAVNDQGKHYWEEVLRFDFIPQGWTPQNVAEKLKTHLPYL